MRNRVCPFSITIKPAACICLFLLLGILIISIFPNSFSPYNPNDMFPEILSAPSLKHFCGTDGLGRDILSLLIHSTKATLLSGISIALISGIIGIVFGCLSGVGNSFMNNLIVEITNLFSIIPTVFIILLVSTIGRISFPQYVIVASLSFWTGTARIMRSQILSTMQLPYIKYLYRAGEKNVIILIKHLIPHSMPPVIANIALTVVNACILECGMSYIGIFGLEYSLGRIMNHGMKYLLSAWWIILFPVTIILIICVSILVITNSIKRESLNI